MLIRNARNEQYEGMKDSFIDWASQLGQKALSTLVNSPRSREVLDFGTRPEKTNVGEKQLRYIMIIQNTNVMHLILFIRQIFSSTCFEY